MLILAFDTTGPHGGAALYRGAASLGEARPSGKANYSVALFEMAGRLLAGCGQRLADVELFAAATGPGSFTGIRVGLAAAQGWAGAFGRPVRGVSALEAMVEAAQPAAGIAVPVLDAHRGELYFGVYRRAAASGAGESAFALSGEGGVMPPGGVVALVTALAREAGVPVTVVAREQDAAARELAAGLGEAACAVVPDFLAASVAQAAWRAAREGRLQQPCELDAWYIRRSDAELNWRG